MKKQRVETYLDPATVKAVTKVARKRDCSSSKVIRDATEKEVEDELDNNE